MKNHLFTFYACLLLGCCPLYAKIDSLFPSEEGKIAVNHRILAKIDDKPISTYDLMKRMDLVFYKHFPEYSSSVVARYQFYQANWRDTLEEIIGKELILADAKEHKIEISNGDIRQEMESLFGPQLIVNLEKANLSFEEAFKIIQEDLLIRRMVDAKVNARAVRSITPSKVRKTYEEFISDPKNKRPTQWSYRVITVRDRTAKKAEETAQIAFQALTQENVPLDQVVAYLKENQVLGRKAKITISEEIKANESELSESYLSILSNMNANMFSSPTPQKSRATQTTVYRIFYVKEKILGGVPTFKEMENPLKEKLVNQVADLETGKYLKKLQHHFHVREQDLNAMIPKDYEPFILTTDN